jgi:DNA-binding beta-propeller fold protein YncE
MPSDIDGPHNITAAPDGKSYYVTVAHGTPFGSVWKFDARTDSIVGKAQVELFPTTISVTPDGQLAFVANSDFHGDHPRTNVVSVIHTPTMTKITDLDACDMPHGVKVNHAGTRVWVDERPPGCSGASCKSAITGRFLGFVGGRGGGGGSTGSLVRMIQLIK